MLHAVARVRSWRCHQRLLVSACGRADVEREVRVGRHDDNRKAKSSTKLITYWLYGPSVIGMYLYIATVAAAGLSASAGERCTATPTVR